MRIHGLLMAAVLLTPVYGQSVSLSDLPPLPQVQPKKKANPEGLVHVAADGAWRGWLARHYPDREPSWPPEARLSFQAFSKSGRWDFVGTGDYDRDGKPTALLIRFRPSKKTGSGVIARLAVAKHLDGKWTELLDLDSAKGARMNGAPDDDLDCQDGYLIDLVLGDPGDAARPGMSFFLELANRNGEGMSDPAQLYYVPKDGKFLLGEE